MSWRIKQIKLKDIMACAALSLFLLMLSCENSHTGANSINNMNSNMDKSSSSTRSEDRIVDVRLMDFSIDMPTQFVAGSTTFKVTNASSVPHNFVILRNDADTAPSGMALGAKFSSKLRPGEKNTLQIILRSGSYKAFCPEEDYAQRGMSREFDVK